MKFKNEYSSRFRILKGGKISLVVSALLGGATMSFAAPTDGTVTSGVASISQNANVTTITQSTQKASINWQNFSIAQNETVNFNQPNASSITLNRVIGNEKSIISGALNANGQVWILNSNGILFNKNASINTSGLLATTKNLTDTDFQSGNYNFTGDSTQSVINLGTIDIQNNGSVILGANEVQNEGTIKAIKGKIHLIGAEEYSIDLNGNSLVSLTVSKGVLDAMVTNSGTIIADGGEVYLTTNAVGELLKGVVNNTGVIEANSIDDFNTHVELFAHGGTVNIGGTIEAIDGFVETSGKEFSIQENTVINTAKWLIDPVDITIDDTLASTIETALGTADVTIQTISAHSTVPTTSNQTSTDGDTTDGDIYVNSEIEWSSTKKLTLDASDSIYINSSITASAGQLALYYGQSSSNSGNTATYNINAKVNLSAGDNFFTKLGSDGTDTIWTVVTDATSLQNISLTGNTVLGADVDASSITNWNPIGDSYTNSFTGTFDGLNHTIDKLTIDKSTSSYIGLFGYTKDATIKNIGVTDVDIKGRNNVGGLVGYNTFSTIENSYASVSGSVIGNNYVGGLVGNNYSSTITNSYATGSVSGVDSIGGLAGYNGSSTIENSYASGSVSGDAVGGLVGSNTIYSSTITNSYYDTDTNTATMNDSADYGKTQTEILSAFSGLTGWTTSLSDATLLLPYLTEVTREQDILKIAIVTPTPEPTPTEEPTVEPTEEPIVTPISVSEKNVDLQKEIDSTEKIQTHLVQIKPIIDNSIISFEEEGKELIKIEGVDTENSSFSINSDSSLVVVNGGVHLPSGLEQEFYSMKNKEGK